MIAQVRQEKILEAVQNHEVVYLKDLVAEIGTSESTLRRDITKLVEEKRLESLRGGAVRLKSRRSDPTTLQNQSIRMEAKTTIARKAADLVENGDIIYIDAGSTTALMTRFLEGKKVTVVTPSLAVLQQTPVNGVAFVAIGGEVNHETASMGGPLAEKMLSEMFFDKAFLSISAYSEKELFANDIREGRKKEIVKERSSATFVLADSSKEHHLGFLHVMDRSECIMITEKPDEADEEEAGHDPAVGQERDTAEEEKNA